MKILFIGTRGIPANYSGFEICVQEVAKRLQYHHQISLRKERSLQNRTKKIENIKSYTFLA